MKRTYTSVYCFTFAMLWGIFPAQIAVAQNNYQIARTFGGPPNGQTVRPQGITTDRNGNVFVVNTGKNNILKFTEGGTFLFQFGVPGNFSGNFVNPNVVAVNSAGNIYVADGMGRVQKFDASGRLLTYLGVFSSISLSLKIDSKDNLFIVDAGNSTISKFDSLDRFLFRFGSSGSRNGEMNSPRGIDLDQQGNIFVADLGNNRIEKFNAAGKYLSQFGKSGQDDGQFTLPTDVAISAEDAVYVADAYNNRVQKFDKAGNFLWKTGALGSGPGQFNINTHLTAGNTGNIYVSDTYNDRIQILDRDGKFLSQFGKYAPADGDVGNAGSIAIDGSDHIYAMTGGNKIFRKFDSKGNFLAQFGTYGDGVDQFPVITNIFPETPSVVTTDRLGNVYGIDRSGNILKFDPNGVFIRRFGNWYPSLNGQLDRPAGIAVDADSNIYVADTYHNRIVKLDPNGDFVTNITQTDNALFPVISPTDIKSDAGGNIYALAANQRILKFDKNGSYLTSLYIPAPSDAPPSTSYHFTLDKYGNLYIVGGDSANVFSGYVEKFDRKGKLLAQFGYFGNGSGPFASATGIAVDSQTNVFIGDGYHNRIVEFAAATPVLTFDGIAPDAAMQTVVFIFRPDDGSSPVTRTLSIPASGQYNISGLSTKAGILHIKPDKYLAVNVFVDFSAGNITGVDTQFQPGDANNDNSVDSTDFTALIGSYNSDITVPGSGYDPTADFNGDGFVDSSDFMLLIGSFNQVGDL